MKPKEKMVGINKLELDFVAADGSNENAKVQADPYGLKNLFPDYLVVKAIFPGEYELFLIYRSFGEVAIKMESSRASTVFAVENCHLLYMSEAAYVQLLDPYIS